MDRKFRWIAMGIICVLSFGLLVSNAVFANEATIVGKVNDSYQIVTKDGAVYEVADTDVGNDLLNHVGETVEAAGMISEEDGVKVIKVTSYMVIEST
jgi:hypothetical protein